MNRSKQLSIGLVKIIYCVGIFFCALFLFSGLMNRGNTDMTMEMSKPLYPIVSFLAGENTFNSLRAYIEEADINKMRSNITPLNKERGLTLKIDTYGREISGLSYELRSLLDGRLIEETEVFDYMSTGQQIIASLKFRDLIQTKTEYSLCIKLTMDSKEVLRYYTNVEYDPSLDYISKLNYVFDFDETSFNARKAQDELGVYLESDATGDNSSFAHVNIHSSLTQVTWGNLKLRRTTEPVAEIREINGSMAAIRMNYIVELQESEKTQYYIVEEYFRIRQGSERMYLLEFEREMQQVFDQENWVIANNKIQLGITDTNVEFMESSDGNYFAFVSAGRLYSYAVNGNKLAEIYSFYDVSSITDRRSTDQNYEIKICQVDETGNVIFTVNGYSNCGIHEGSTGVTICYYDSSRNIVEEMAYIPYKGCPEYMRMEMQEMCYVNNSENCFFLLENSFYRISLADRRISTLASNIEQGGFVAAPTGRSVAWINKGTYDSSTIFYMNLDLERRQEITSIDGKYVRLIGFFEDDLIYGEVDPRDIAEDISGHKLFPMSSLSIRSSIGEVLKEYSQDGVYIVDTEMDGNMLTIHRVVKDEETGYQPIADDQILNNATVTRNRNSIETVVTETYETLVQIAVRKDFSAAAMQILEPRQIIFEGNRQVSLKEEAERRSYIVTEGGEPLREYRAVYDAINTVYNSSGAVRTNDGLLVYRKTVLPDREQILNISMTALGEDAAAEEVAAEALRAMMSYAGAVEIKPYEAGMDIREYMQECLPNDEILDLGGLPSELILYYPAHGIPIAVQFLDGSVMLITGYNEYNVIVMDPAVNSDNVYRIGKNDAHNLFAENGNRFYTYVKHED